MPLASDFQFSQGSLQDYVDCRRRFQLRYLQQLAWPAVEAEPVLENERRLRMGAAFHRLVQQHLLGLPADRLSEMAASNPAGEQLQRWWRHYLEHGKDLTGFTELSGLDVEVTLSTGLLGYRLLAKFDAILCFTGQDGLRVVIVDWKTYQVRPRRLWLAERLQSRVYPYLLVKAGAHLNQGVPFLAGQVEMIYWFAEFPREPERFAYSLQQFGEDEAYLAGLVKEIESLGEGDFPLTAREERCAYCTFRSYCDRGVKAGDLVGAQSEWEAGEDFDLPFDFDQIQEIAY